jgi:hypothetical protein
MVVALVRVYSAGDILLGSLSVHAVPYLERTRRD